ncbi:MAG: PIN domain-containing protein [Acidobacteriia bacterium]|nr:PIN domain-containing protein [Terriglobia bacterium]
MIALDTNILIAAMSPAFPNYTVVRRWLGGVPEPVVTTHTNIAEFLRLVTHPRVFTAPLTLFAAVSAMHSFVDGLDLRVLESSDHWWTDLITLDSLLPRLRGNEVFDAQIALCLRFHGVKTICSFDSDFDKYRFLKRVVPS